MKSLFMFCLFSTLGFASSLNKEDQRIKKEREIVSTEVSTLDAVQCCKRWMSSGTYGQANYNYSVVTICATSTKSWQDAMDKACVLADATVKKSLEIAAASSDSVIVNDGR
jgi:hypothetical protein